MRTGWKKPDGAEMKKAIQTKSGKGNQGWHHLGQRKEGKEGNEANKMDNVKQEKNHKLTF